MNIAICILCSVMIILNTIQIVLRLINTRDSLEELRENQKQVNERLYYMETLLEKINQETSIVANRFLINDKEKER